MMKMSNMKRLINYHCKNCFKFDFIFFSKSIFRMNFSSGIHYEFSRVEAFHM